MKDGPYDVKRKVWIHYSDQYLMVTLFTMPIAYCLISCEYCADGISTFLATF